jgi:hypothetical protein
MFNFAFNGCFFVASWYTLTYIDLYFNIPSHLKIENIFTYQMEVKDSFSHHELQVYITNEGIVVAFPYPFCHALLQFKT